MKEILTFCVSRGRPERILEVINAWRENSAGVSDFVLMLHDDDEKLLEYKKNIENIKDIKVRIPICPPETHKGCVYLVNKAIELFPNYNYYTSLADDTIPRTKNYDKILMDKIKENGDWGIAYGDDLYNKGLTACAPVVSGKMVRMLGYFVPPIFYHHYSDLAVKDIANGIEKFFYVPEVAIEWMDFENGKAEHDKTYEEVHSPEIVNHDRNAYEEWKRSEYPEIVKKLRKKIYG